MRPGIEHGVGIVELEVTPAMTATLDERPIHPVYSTFWLAYHAEVAARRAIEPYFEPGDNAVGVSVSIDHVAMAAVGANVRITARVTDVRGRYVGCTIEAVVMPSETVIATGSQGQVLLPDSVLKEKTGEALRG
jgi:predicted thioesterase